MIQELDGFIQYLDDKVVLKQMSKKEYNKIIKAINSIKKAVEKHY